MSSTTFDFILNEIGEAISSQDTNFRKSIAPAEKLLVILRWVQIIILKTKYQNNMCSVVFYSYNKPGTFVFCILFGGIIDQDRTCFDLFCHELMMID